MLKKLILLAIVVVGLYFFGRTLMNQLIGEQIDNVQETVEDVGERIDEVKDDVQETVDAVGDTADQVGEAMNSVSDLLGGDEVEDPDGE